MRHQPLRPEVMGADFCCVARKIGERGDVAPRYHSCDGHAHAGLEKRLDPADGRCKCLSLADDLVVQFAHCLDAHLDFIKARIAERARETRVDANSARAQEHVDGPSCAMGDKLWKIGP